MAEVSPSPELSASTARKRRMDLRWQKILNSRGDIISRKTVGAGSSGHVTEAGSNAGSSAGSTFGRLPRRSSDARDAAGIRPGGELFRSSSSSSSADHPSAGTIAALSAAALKVKFRRPQFRRFKDKQEKAQKHGAKMEQEGSLEGDDDGTSSDVASEASSSGTSSSSDEDAVDAVVSAATSLLREEMSLDIDLASGKGSVLSSLAPVTGLPAVGSDSADQALTGSSGSVVHDAPSQCAWPQDQHGNAADQCPGNGVLSVCGRRREMEDAVAMLPAFAVVSCHCSVGCMGVHQALHTETTAEADAMSKDGKCQLHLFAVFDGHGGSQAAKFCSQHLGRVLAEELSVTLDEAKALAGPAHADAVPAPGATGLQEDHRGALSHAPQASGAPVVHPEEHWKKALTKAFARLDAEVSGHCFQRRSSCNMSGHCGHEPLADETVGTTAVVSVLTQRHIIVSNCGDSRAVLCRGGRAIALSKDHKPDREDEMKRIEKAGGRVVFWNGYRVLGVLAMSRAIGDRYLKPYVIPEPEITFTERAEDDECLILASDGLWDVITNETACDIARKCLTTAKPEELDAAATAGGADVSLAGPAPTKDQSPAALAAAVLTRLALARGSSDNTSVVVVDLRRNPKEGN